MTTPDELPVDRESPAEGPLPVDGESPDFAKLILAAKGGSRQAIGELMNGCRDYLLLVANEDLDQGLRTKLGASDVVQDVLLSAQNAIGEFRGQSREEFIGWLRGILVNDLLETRRKYRGTAKRQIDREVSLSGEDFRGIAPDAITAQHPTPGTQAIANEETAALQRALEQLSHEHRQVLQLRNWQQLSFSDVGTEIGLSANAARKLWTRAVLALQRELEFNDGPDRPGID